MKKMITTLSALLIVTLSFGQDFSIISQKTIGGTGDESDFIIIPDLSATGEYFLVSYSNSGISGDKTEVSRGGFDVWVAKLDSDFNVLWDKTYGGDENDILTSAFASENYIIVSTSSGSNQSGDKTMDLFGDANIWLLCLDHSGNLIWQGQYGGSVEEWRPNVLPYTDSTFLMFCGSRSPVSGNKTVAPIGDGDIWIVEIEYATGEITRQKIIGSENHDNINVVSKTSNGHYFVSIEAGNGISGDKTDFGYGGNDIWLIELDENLDIVRDKCFGGNNLDHRGAIYETDEYYYMTASSHSGISGNKTEDAFGSSQDIWLIKMDKDLNIIWDRTIGGLSYDHGIDVFMNANGKLVLYGTSGSLANGNKTSPRYGVSRDLWIVLLSQDGELLEQFTVGGDSDDWGRVFPHPTDASKLLFCASTDSPAGTGNKTAGVIGGADIWLGVIDASNVLGITDVEATIGEVFVYPNPANEMLNIRFNETETKIWLTDVNGKQVTSDFYSSTGEQNILVNDLMEGIYLIHIQTVNGHIVKKVIVG